jgi:ribosomal protein S20
MDIKTNAADPIVVCFLENSDQTFFMVCALIINQELLVCESKIQYTYGMPLTKRAIKKMYHDRKRTKTRAKTEEMLRALVKTMRKKPSQKTLTSVFSALDKAAKTRIIHPNRANRLKARLTKLIAKK